MTTAPNQEIRKHNTYKKELKKLFDKYEDTILERSVDDSEISVFFLCLEDFINEYFH